MTRKKVTAAELMAKLQADPAFVAKRAQEEEERQKRAAEWRRAEEPLVEELQRAGLAVESAWDLVNTAGPYPRALPILLEHLSRPYPGPVREGIRACPCRARGQVWLGRADSALPRRAGQTCQGWPGRRDRCSGG